MYVRMGVPDAVQYVVWTDARWGSNFLEEVYAYKCVLQTTHTEQLLCSWSAWDQEHGLHNIIGCCYTAHIHTETNSKELTPQCCPN